MFFTRTAREVFTGAMRKLTMAGRRTILSLSLTHFSFIRTGTRVLYTPLRVSLFYFMLMAIYQR